MKTPLILLTISLLGCAAVLLFPAYSDALLILGPMVIASLWLVFRSLRSAISTDKSGSADKTPDYVIIDGSNVMYWLNNRPEWQPLLEVLRQMKVKGYTCGVMFDANAGYKLEDKYLHEREFAKRLGIGQDRIMVVPSRTPADGYILQAARDYQARIVTNDRFRDWADRFPEVTSGSLMITGHYEDGQLRLSL